jgi:hypothetical protein
MPFKAIGFILLAGFLLGFTAVPFSQMLDKEPAEYHPVAVLSYR